jgi:hypothetical protein
MVINADAVKGNETAHGGTADGGVFPIGYGTQMLVHIGLQLTGQPLHIYRGFSGDAAVILVAVGNGGVLHQAVMAFMVAFHSHDDEVLSRESHIVFHAPGFAECGIFIPENVVTVKHVKHRVTLVRMLFIVLGQPDVGFPGCRA